MGSHSSRHPHPWRSDPVSLGLDLARGHRQLEAAGLRPAGYRPQYGKVVASTWLWSLLRRQPLRWWTVDSGVNQGEPGPGRVVGRGRVCARVCARTHTHMCVRAHTHTLARGLACV